jgi:hypothetical protein
MTTAHSLPSENQTEQASSSKKTTYCDILRERFGDWRISEKRIGGVVLQRPDGRRS